MAEKTISEQLTDLQGVLEVKAATEAKNAAIEATKDYTQKITDAETKAGKAEKEAAELKDEVKELKEAADKNQQAFDKLFLRSKAAQGGQEEVKSFNQILGETIERNAKEIKNFKRNQQPLHMDMMPEVKEVNEEGKREVKAVGDMSIATNFPGAVSIYQDIRPLIIQPYNRTWLGDLLPGGTSNGTSLLYPKENGTDGGAGLWEDPTQDKAEMDFNINATSAAFKWLAGIVIVDRDMLDDITFLTAYIQNKMLISLKTAENAFILNGSDGTKANPVIGLLAAATAYSGVLANPVDKIIDAAWGQLVEDTFGFYTPTNVITMPRDAVTKLGLNKASGSGEYDLPAGSVAFVNGKLIIGGLEQVSATQIGANNFLAFDKSATMFVKRMAPELRLFEDATLAKKNKLMFRIEERATLAIFNNAAIVKGTLS